MALLGNLIARSLRIRKQFRIKTASPKTYQMRTLRYLVERGQYTQFGKQYKFDSMLGQSLDWVADFKKNVPFHNYNSMFAQWWHKCLAGEENVTWPGRVNYFALSSGTSESASKHIPVTREMIRSTQKVGFRQFYSMSNFPIPPATFEKGVLMLGGSTSLNRQGDIYEGDMSGISAKNMPRLLSNFFYKPGQKISKQPLWEDRIGLIVEKAPSWDVGILCGVPAWAQIVLEEIVKKYGLNTIHDMWPNLRVYIHGGVAIEPYRENLKRLLSKQVAFIETYMASEGSFGFQARPGVPGIKLVLNAGILFEFLPFTAENFDDNGELIGHPQTHFIHEVQPDVAYAVVLSTCAGAWRYLIGDVVKFTDVAAHEIVIVGRTKQYLSLCGEHTSVDNLNAAIDEVNKQLGIAVREFTVGGMPYENLFAHKWYIGCDEPVGAAAIKRIVDRTLCAVNDDYAVERTSALKEVLVEVLPGHVFTDFLKATGRYGAMNKIPRVMKGKQLEEWEQFLRNRS
ncbi:MAG: GH3 auxin-responsive promoter family protein [Edaphocola sp.]